jgi:hypothetical protein
MNRFSSFFPSTYRSFSAPRNNIAFSRENKHSIQNNTIENINIERTIASSSLRGHDEHLTRGRHMLSLETITETVNIERNSISLGRD